MKQSNELSITLNGSNPEGNVSTRATSSEQAHDADDDLEYFDEGIRINIFPQEQTWKTGFLSAPELIRRRIV